MRRAIQSRRWDRLAAQEGIVGPAHPVLERLPQFRTHAGEGRVVDPVAGFVGIGDEVEKHFAAELALEKTGGKSDYRAA